ncbi:hypothetical protein BT96DRAFT_998800 [Gymnopus androsaceus JB14]|uniref:Uncharacterized protein n=1 Tax=Gymnopus androsaceus JB14 TaxID=1447944 RepID=A0A6A4H8P7_9AGAR|nr:hypothetical protein BT96DRAFT_998800 [Gymnopus androsaceus JB14]
MSSGNSPLNVPSFPKASQLSGQDTWWPFKDQVELTIEVRGLKGYLNGSIPKPTTPTSILLRWHLHPTAILHPQEWNQREWMVASIIYLNCTNPVGLGIERGTLASKTWEYLVKKYEARNEQ